LLNKATRGKEDQGMLLMKKKNGTGQLVGCFEKGQRRRLSPARARGDEFGVFARCERSKKKERGRERGDLVISLGEGGEKKLKGADYKYCKSGRGKELFVREKKKPARKAVSRLFERGRKNIFRKPLWKAPPIPSASLKGEGG